MEEEHPATSRSTRRKASLIQVAVRLGLVLPIVLGLASIVLLTAMNLWAPEWHAPVLFTLILVWVVCWLYASIVVFRAALAEERATWFAGVLLFLVPFQAWLVVSTGVRNVGSIVGLVSP